MKPINKYILEKLKITKNYKFNPEYELNISKYQLEYIDVLIILANNKDVHKSTVKTVYDSFTNKDNLKDDKNMENFVDNLFKYLNNHPNLPKMLGNTFDDIYAALSHLPEDELIQYRNKSKDSK